MSAIVTRETCGRCGVYRTLHPVPWCDGFRASWWLDRHYAHAHVGVWLWVHVIPSRTRWAVAEWIRDHFGRCWCDLVDSCYRADEWDTWRSDYEDLCDFPAPWNAGAPRPGKCYCAGPGEERDAARQGRPRVPARVSAMTGYREHIERWRHHKPPAARHWPRDPDDLNTHPGSDPETCAICRAEKEKP